MTVKTNLKQLYEIDDQEWLNETINLLKQRRFNELDLDKVYRKALKYVTKKTNFKVDFPEECPYTVEQLLDENYL